MASIALPHVSTENDRQINLSQHVLSTRVVTCERSIFVSLRGLQREFLGIGDVDSGCTIADKVAEGHLAAGFIK